MFNSFGRVLATKTIEAINKQLEKDQGNKFRALLKEFILLAEDAYSQKTDDVRTHLGASLIGKGCTRELWYTFRWAAGGRFEGRMIRLFNRGHLEEPRFVALLRMIGCEVWQYEDNGGQFQVSFHNGHFGGSLDCVLRGCPDDPSQPLLGEFKTYNEKSFEKLQKEGVRTAKFEHYVQMQIYMGGKNLAKALYLAVNKNTDELYGELIPFDPEQFQESLKRGGLIIQSGAAPPRINESPGWFACKFCNFRQICHFKAQADRNCRTCIFSLPGNNGIWTCQKHQKRLTKEEQLAGCSDYRFIPSL
jgi:hypothetical protein